MLVNTNICFLLQEETPGSLSTRYMGHAYTRRVLANTEAMNVSYDYPENVQKRLSAITITYNVHVQ